ncbi:MAG: PD-(D/E)XK nuclease family protein [Akkermansiaceae bacterium]|nr:PD-(D/E)XK nuclease family protein [Akkermansiaceae bacterium]
MQLLNLPVPSPRFNEVLRIFRQYSKPLNFLDLIGLNENAHTRVLASLLDFRRQGEPVFLKSFLRMVSESIAADATNDHWSKALVLPQSNYIDCLVNVGKWAVVIENKIHGARDQGKQLETYIQRAKEPPEIDEVWVGYLTLTGGSPSIVSLSEEGMKQLGDRFVGMSFQNEILPWLQREVLPNCRISESSLVNSLRVYIDHLNGILGQKQGEQAMFDRLFGLLDLKPDIDSHRMLSKYCEQFVELDSEADDFIDHSDFREAIQGLMREIERKIPYANEDHVAYLLKGMFRNEPPWLERATWEDGCANVDPMVPSVFLHYGVRHLQLKRGSVRIHLQCSLEGIRNGPYLLVDGSGVGAIENAERHFGKESLESIGMKRGDYVFHFPFESFDPELTSVLAVAQHIKSLVDALKRLPSGLD